MTGPIPHPRAPLLLRGDVHLTKGDTSKQHDSLACPLHLRTEQGRVGPVMNRCRLVPWVIVFLSQRPDDLVLSLWQLFAVCFTSVFMAARGSSADIVADYLAVLVDRSESELVYCSLLLGAKLEKA